MICGIKVCVMIIIIIIIIIMSVFLELLFHVKHAQLR